MNETEDFPMNLKSNLEKIKYNKIIIIIVIE